MIPVNSLSYRYKLYRLLKSHINDGSVPDSLLLPSERDDKFDKYCNESGMVPVNSFPLKLRLSKFDILPIQLGIIPEN